MVKTNVCHADNCLPKSTGWTLACYCTSPPLPPGPDFCCCFLFHCPTSPDAMEGFPASERGVVEAVEKVAAVGRSLESLAAWGNLYSHGLQAGSKENAEALNIQSFTPAFVIVLPDDSKALCFLLKVSFYFNKNARLKQQRISVVWSSG